MAKIYKNVLMVEGQDELRTIPYLIEANGIEWEPNGQKIVLIQEYEGFSNLSSPDEITTELQISGREALGIIFDADDNPDGQWQSIKNSCLPSIPDLPESIPAAGLIHIAKLNNGREVRFGIWMMPDNKMRGMLETFLAYMIPDQSDRLWKFAQEVSIESKNRGATFKDSYFDKANIYTWLAWQEEPGRQLHQAIKHHILQPQHPKANSFVTWFKDLYCLK
jgi:hypothetical protein